jgi:hypothetical protein
VHVANAPHRRSRVAIRVRWKYDGQCRFIGRPAGDRVGREARTARMGIEDQQFVREAPETFHQRVELARGPQLIQAAEPMAHALDDTAVDALVFDEEKVGAVTARLGADEHRRRPDGPQ